MTKARRERLNLARSELALEPGPVEVSPPLRAR